MFSAAACDRVILLSITYSGPDAERKLSKKHKLTVFVGGFEHVLNALWTAAALVAALSEVILISGAANVAHFIYKIMHKLL